MEFIQAVEGFMELDKLDSLELRKNGIYEPNETETIKSLLKPTDIVFDIGANIGYYTLIMAKRAGHVVAFEADPSNFELLCKNIDLNDLSNVAPLNYAVTDLTGVTELYKCENNSGMHRVYPSHWCKGEVLKVDSMKLDDQFHKVDFIKMDIEGAEYYALRGMETLLAENHPKIIMEFHAPSIIESGIEPLMIYYFLKDLGYSITLLPDRPNISGEELVEFTMHEVARNILCQ